MAKWAKIGNVCKSKTNDGRYVKFADNVTILKSGEEVEMNLSRTGNIAMSKKENDLVIADIFIKDTKIGEIRKGKETKPNYISFDKAVTFKVDAAPFNANKNNAAQLQDPVQSLERRIKTGRVKESDVERLREKVKQIATWLEYEVVLPDESPMK